MLCIGRKGDKFTVDLSTCNTATVNQKNLLSRTIHHRSLRISHRYSKRKYGYNQPIHKNGKSDAEVLVFFGQYNTQEVVILDHTAVQVFLISQHFFHGPVIIREGHLVKVPKE